jgi:rhamnosyltransferase subunit B
MSDSRARANVALVAFGSAGDVHPMLAIGRHLRARGHQVRVLTNPAFAGAVSAAELEILPVGSLDDHRQTIAHPKLWHPIDGFGVMWRYLLRPALEPTYRALEQLLARDRWVAIASPVAMGARIAQEQLGMPLVSVYTAATMLRTVHRPMTMAQWRVPRWLPHAARALAWRLLDRHKLQPLVLPDLERLRGALGLPAIRGSVLGRWMHSPLAGAALFPSWFAPRAPDWPQQVVHAGFPFYDEREEVALAGTLQDFLQAGARPVVFMPGSAAHADMPFYEAALRACAGSRERGLLLGDVPDAVRAALPPTVHAETYAPFARLLPLSRALVHHGGIGSCAQAIRAGIPQLIVPRAYDQFDNAMRVETLNVGAMLPRPSLDDLGSVLARLLASAEVAKACARTAARVHEGAGLEVVSSMVEHFA